MEEPIVSSLIDAIVGKVASAALDEVMQLWGVGEEVIKLKDKLSIIRGYLRDAEERQLKDESVKQWLRILTDIAYEADDLLDEFAAEALRSKSDGNAMGEDMIKKKRAHQRGWFSSCPNCMKQVSSRHRIARWILSLKLRLDEILKFGLDLQLKVLGGTRSQLEVPAWRETSSFLDHKVIGMDGARDKIISSLLKLDDDDGDLPVLAIVGIGGIGKTTLARYVFNDKRVKQHFDLMMWVFVSSDFNVKRLAKQLISASDGGKSYSEDASLDSLQRDLAERIYGKRFLLVLDDAWNNDWHLWEQLRAPLHEAARGSKILVTTRSYNVSHAVGAIKRFHLEGLLEEDYWSFFKICAFGSEDPKKHPKLEDIGRKIADKLKGSPLAAKTLGRILSSSLDESHWTKIKDSELWELEQGKNEILPALRLSYQYLPAHLKQCFGYCSVFPKDWQFDRNKLVQMWMGQGFIQPHYGERSEDVGIRYFNDLLSLFFFQPSQHGYTMHHLIHDLAQYIYVDECFRVDIKLHRIPDKVRHLSLSIPNPDRYHLQYLSKLRTLRSLLFTRGFQLPFDCIPRGLFIELKYIRVLDLRSCQIVEVPNSICDLKHLRFLDLSSNLFQKLPEMFRSLYHLQTLRLETCKVLSDLPRGMSELTNLRHLKADSKLITKIDGIGNLTALQELEVFKVYNQNGFRIGELKGMAELGGRLSIQNLVNVQSGDEAREAKLDSKPSLSAVELEWNADDGDDTKAFLKDSKDDDKILEALQPHENIKELCINGYGGTATPSWMQGSSCPNLEVVSLWNCRKWEALPPLGQLQFLKCLKIRGMDGVKQVGSRFYGGGVAGKVFPSLEELEFHDMPEWEEWSKAEVGQCFPRLSKLAILKCPKFKSLNKGLLSKSLGSLTVRDCKALSILPACFEALTSLQELTMENCPEAVSGWLFRRLRGLNSLTSCMISKEYPNFMESGDQDVFNELEDVQQLRINFLEQGEKDKAMPEGHVLFQYNRGLLDSKNTLSSSQVDLKIVGPHGAPSRYGSNSLIRHLAGDGLRRIPIWDITGSYPEITTILGEVVPRLKPLKKLKINNCEELTSLGPHTLKELIVENCGQLTSLDLAALQHLTITDCPELTNITYSMNLRPTPGLRSLKIDKFSPQLLTSILSQRLASLCELWIGECYDLHSLPEELSSLSSLEVLYIWSCPQLQFLPTKGLPKRLAHFEMRSCPQLKHQCRNDDGPDWPKIKHIPTIIADGEEIQMK